MALNITTLPRVFKHGTIELTDPDRNLSPDYVIRLYRNTYPSLTKSIVIGPKLDSDSLIF
ncbi:MAG: PRTRC system protein C [Tannerellaceae bacterium]